MVRPIHFDYQARGRHEQIYDDPWKSLKRDVAPENDLAPHAETQGAAKRTKQLLLRPRGRVAHACSAGGEEIQASR